MTFSSVGLGMSEAQPLRFFGFALREPLCLPDGDGAHATAARALARLRSALLDQPAGLGLLSTDGRWLFLLTLDSVCDELATVAVELNGGPDLPAALAGEADILLMTGHWGSLSQWAIVFDGAARARLAVQPCAEILKLAGEQV